MRDERELRARLEHQRELSGAEVLAVSDHFGFFRVATHSMKEDVISQVLDLIGRIVEEFGDVGSILPKSRLNFLISHLGNRYLYLTPITEELFLIGIFSLRTNLVKIIQAMSAVEEELKASADTLSVMLSEKKERYLKEKQTTRAFTPPKKGTDRLSALQVDAILEEFRNELGPAGDIIFNQTAQELGIDLKNVSKEEGTELVRKLADEIENRERRERFTKTALNIIEG